MAPRSEGEFEIQLPESLRNAEKLELTVTGVRGFVIDEYSFRILPEQTKPQGQGQSGQLSCQEKADVIEIQSVGGVFTVDKRNGLLSAGQGGNAVLLQSPVLMVLPLNGDGEGVQMVGKDQKFKPYNSVCENWIAQSVTCLPGDELISIKVKGIYKEAEGIFEYRFHKNGEVTFVYDFTMLQDISPRQTGLVFTLPSSFTHLDWKRKGYWNVYPEDHIGALTGQAEAFDASLPVSGLAGPSKQPVKSWSYDQTAAGSNMFRSTKENIYSARLKDGSGQSVTVKSDGTQYVRAWIEGDAIRLLVAGYNNPGKENFLIPHAEKEYKPLRKGDKVQGKVTVSFHP